MPPARRATSGSTPSSSCGTCDAAGEDGVDEKFLSEIAEVTPGLDQDEWEAEFDDQLSRQRDDPDYESTVDADGELAFELKLPAQPVGGRHRARRRRRRSTTRRPSTRSALAIERVEVPPPRRTSGSGSASVCG